MIYYKDYNCKDNLTEKLLKEITAGIVSGCPREYLEKVILYGSYSRNEHTEDSDIDIMILVNAEPLVEQKLYSKTMDWVGDVCNKYCKIIPPAMTSLQEFEMYKDIKFYYKEITKDGVILYERDKVNTV